MTKLNTGHKVLVVDDEPYIRKCFESMLVKLGHEAVSARSASEGVQRFHEMQSNAKPFDLVFVDLHLPEKLGGVKLCDEIREVDKNVTIILASGDTANPVMQDYRKHGFDGILKKPFSLAQIDAVLRLLPPKPAVKISIEE